MNLDDLLGIGDVVPVPVGFPAFRDNLNEDASCRRLWNMGDALHVGLDVDFGLFVFNEAIFLSFEIDAGVFNRLIPVAPGDFDCETGNRRRRRSFLGRRGLLRAGGSAGRAEDQGKAD